MGEFFAAPRRAVPELCDGIKRYLHPRCTCIRKDEDHRIDGDFSARPERPGLAFAQGHRLPLLVK